MYEVWKNGFIYRNDYTTKESAKKSAQMLAGTTGAACDVYTADGELIATYLGEGC